MYFSTKLKKNHTTEIFDVRLSEDKKTVAGVGLIFGEASNEQEVNFNQVNAPMYSITTGVRNENYEAVGEKMNLDFTRPFPILMFTSNESNEAYNEYLGKLQSVAVETKGAEGLEATKIASTMTVAMTADGVFDPLFESGFTSSSKAEVKLNNASLWNSEDKVFMSIFPVQRKDVVQEDETKKSFTENYTVTYDYEHVTLTKNLKSSSDWNVPHQVYGIEELNIANDFSYIVTKNNKLIVFSKTFSEVFNEDKTAVNWDNTDFEFADFTEIVSNVALTDEEMQSLKKFTGLKKLTLKENTSIPADVFDATLAANITDLALLKVTSIKTENVAFSNLENLDLSSCQFNFDGAEVLFFNENVKNTLVTLDIEAVESLRPAFGYDPTIVFTNYAKLQKVILNSKGVALTGMAFAGCGALETVTGVVDIMNAPNAFEKAATGEKVPVINVANTVIPNYAFAESGIGQVLYNGVPVIPTEIGECAFFNNKAIETMDLSKATVIGKSAFNLASNFVGTADSETERGVITIIAEEVNDLILANTKVVRVQFKNATTLGSKILGNAHSLKQVKFLKEIDSDCVSSAFEVLDTKKVDLFVYLTQDGINGLKWNGVEFKY